MSSLAQAILGELSINTYFESHTPLHRVKDVYNTEYSDFNPEKFNHNISFTFNHVYESFPSVEDQQISPIDYFSFLRKLLYLEKTNDLSLADHPFIPGVRYYNDSIIVFERPPTQVPFTYSLEYRDNITDSSASCEYYIPIPWQVYICEFNPNTYRLLDVSMFFAKSSLYDLDQDICAPPLFNFYSNGTLCRPFFSDSQDILKYPQNVFGITAAAYDWIWNSNFNYDIVDNIIDFIYKKRYVQFEKYIKNEEDQACYDFLVRYPLNGYSRGINNKYYTSFFHLWSIVPVEEVSFIDFSPYSFKDFYYREQADNVDRYSVAVEFCNANDYLLHEEYYGESECHCDECCEDNCVLYDDIEHVSGFEDYYDSVVQSYEESSSSSKTLRQVIKLRYDKLVNAKVAIIPPTVSQIYNHTQNALATLFSD
jgi:hypothetical protein